MTTGERDDLVALPAEALSRGRTLALRLYAALRTVRVHGPRNAAFHNAVREVRDDVREMLRLGRGKLELRIDGELLLVNGVMVRSAIQGAAQLRDLGAQLAALDVGGIRFEGADSGSLLEAWLTPLGEVGPNASEAAWRVFDALAPRGLITHRPRSLGNDGLELIEVSTRAFALQTFARAVVAFRELVGALETNQDPYVGGLNVVRVVQDMIDVATGYPDNLRFVLEARRVRKEAFAKATGSYFPGHAAGLCACALLIGAELGLDRLRLLDLGTSALLAKVGAALASPADDVPRALSEGEKAEARRTAERALEAMIARSRGGDPTRRRLIVAYEHGLAEPAGGPEGLHPYARIVAVADAYDALITDRPWRGALTPEAALATLEREHRLDPVSVRALRAAHPQRPRVGQSPP